MAKSGPDQPTRRTNEQQAYAMLAASIDYYRREAKQFWWEHFDRLGHPIDDWDEARDVFIVDSAEVLEDWAVPGGRGRTNARRTLQLIGDWTPGSRPTQQLMSSTLPAEVVRARRDLPTPQQRSSWPHPTPTILDR